MEIKYYELNCGVKVKENEEYGCEICRGFYQRGFKEIWV